MSAPPDEENPKRRLVKNKAEEESNARKAEFEEDKALKDKKPSPWSREAWQAAAARNEAGIVRPEPRFPIIIINSTEGSSMSPEKLQDVAGLSSLPDVRWTTRTSVFDSEEEGGSRGPDDGERPEKMQYCDVAREQLVRIKERSDGEKVLVWFDGQKRCAWLAHSVK
jgi:hypothetical protein